ncbi:CPBP family intramembrane glutamic endopeptidase [Anaerotruncus sp. 1XD42-93]|uniref:CPBP family intramembrane glutamic endopeptidase n=1 Tax=Anaerotruncus sp. 1XD42-93 TaxID=2320853 RepID=UPI000EA0D284|nr:CPBP family intramembrane glutamic endopeptidase [Anaerotruncus sp. 1XD42-93]NBK18075.1 CPBP family intramembrane metalloprotease [Anaerotruncus sp. 1XD42-93]RKJ92409.1 CPBP family intramembrane metalloprotease [Anaerotruncus sp. 1XD22-93]
MKKNNVIEMPLKKSVLWRDMIILFVCSMAIPYLVQYFVGLTEDQSLKKFIQMVSVVIWYFVLWVLITKVERRSMAAFDYEDRYLGRQILWGILLGIALFLVLGLVPILLRTTTILFNPFTPESVKGQLLYEFVYNFFFVAQVEEKVFRGYYLARVEEATGSKFIAVLGSTILFVIPHMIARGIGTYLVSTSVMGLVLALTRLRLKTYSMLTVVLAHGLYNFILNIFGLYWIIF